jgi:hypothetical protein
VTTKQIDREQQDGIVDLGPRFDERLAAAFETDILASEEYNRVYQRRLLSPEKELMLAVLEEAIAEFQKYLSARDRKGMRRFADAEEWILENDADWSFSFVKICEVLGLAPNYLRQGLLRWKRKTLTKEFKATIGPRRRVNGGRFLSAA